MRLLLRQYLAMTSLMLRRYRQSHHIWVILAFAGIPAGVCLLATAVNIFHSHGYFAPEFAKAYWGTMRTMAQTAFTGGILHFATIFLALSFGNSAFREELDGQTYHYLMLARTPRWMFIVGKFSGFMLLGGSCLVTSCILMKAFLAISFGSGAMFTFLIRPEIVEELACEALVAVVGLAVYSVFFLVFGMFMRNVLYGLFFYGWEIVSNMMPEVIRNFSIVYHLKAILPYQGSERPNLIGVLAEGPGALQVVLVLGGVFLFCLSLTIFMASRKQCLYGTD